MTYFNRKLEDLNLSAVLEKEENGPNLKYALLLNRDKNGIVYSYVGGGCYDFALVLDGETVNYDDAEGEELDWDSATVEWAKDTGEKVHYAEELMNVLDILGPNIEGGAIVMTDEYTALFKDFNTLFIGDIEPIDFGTMSWG